MKPKPRDLASMVRQLREDVILIRRDLVRRRGGLTPAIPAGVVAPYAGQAAPTGWALCDGSPLSRDDYPDLFAALGTAYGPGDGSTTFNLPDLRGRVVAGVDEAQNEFIDPGHTGGAKDHALTVDELPPHSHPFTYQGTDYSTWPVLSTVASSGSIGFPTGTPRSPAAPVGVGDTGGGQAHSLLQPYMALHFIISVGRAL